jgi:hypothetical protein
MIRTSTVKLSKLPGLAYKQKLTSGGAGLAIITPDDRAAYTINKRDGRAVPYGPVDESVFTNAVIDEALELTRGLPYRKHGKVTTVYEDIHCDETPVELETEDDKISIDVISSIEYENFIVAYTDKIGKFSYQLMNRDLMKFANNSSVVKSMIENKDKDDMITRYIIRSKAVKLAGTKSMDDEFLTAFIETFDSMDTRSAFRELNAHIRSRKSKARR